MFSPFKVPLNAGNILRQLNGKYSAYDMAQYIFWVGDEEGVAKAVQELIDEGLMSRENAIEFLNDIRLGIDYLENTYSTRHGEMKNVRIVSFQPQELLKFPSTDPAARSDDINFVHHWVSARRTFQLQLPKVPQPF